MVDTIGRHCFIPQLDTLHPLKACSKACFDVLWIFLFYRINKILPINKWKWTACKYRLTSMWIFSDTVYYSAVHFLTTICNDDIAWFKLNRKILVIRIFQVSTSFHEYFRVALMIDYFSESYGEVYTLCRLSSMNSIFMKYSYICN